MTTRLRHRQPVSFGLVASMIALVALVACSDGGGSVPSDSSVAAPTTTSNAPGAVDTNTAPWTRVDPPVVDGSTTAVPVSGTTVPDGTYWGTLTGKPVGTSVAFVLTRVYFGAACEQYAAHARGVECMSGYTVQTEPSKTVLLSPDAAVSLAPLDVPDANYAVEVADLLAFAYAKGTSPVEGFTWAPYPFVVTVRDGVATRAEQFWIP